MGLGAREEGPCSWVLGVGSGGREEERFEKHPRKRQQRLKVYGRSEEG